MNIDSPIYIHNFKFSISAREESSTVIRIKSAANFERFKSMEDSINFKKSLSAQPLIEHKNKLEESIVTNVTNQTENIKMESSLNTILNKKISMIKNSNNLVDEKLRIYEKSCNICRIF